MAKVDGWLPKIAIASFTYYCLSFAFEIGYFWKIGIGYMPAFSISEHTVHAASSTLSALGVIIIIYFVAMYPAVGFDTNDTALSMTPPSPEHPVHWSRKLALLVLIVLFSTTYAWDVFPKVFREGMYPSTLFATLASIAMLAYFTMGTFRIRNIFWIYPALIAAVISPVALGQTVYDSFISNNKAIKVTVMIKNKPFSTNVLFIGTDRMLVAGPTSPILVGYPDNSISLQ